MRKAHKGKIKYFACGEYGDDPTKSHRPHYHAIIFGLEYGFSLKDIWSMGKVDYGTVTYDSCRYVAQYIDKKFYGKMSFDEYFMNCRVPPFRLSSLGLGLRFVMDNKVQLTEQLHTTVRGIPCSLPRYYVSKLDISPDLLKAHAVIVSNEVRDSIVAKGHNSVKSYHEQIKKARQQSKATLESRLSMRRARRKF